MALVNKGITLGQVGRLEEGEADERGWGDLIAMGQAGLAVQRCRHRILC